MKTYTYTIYHIHGIKIGCTTDLIKRMADQGFTEWEILWQQEGDYEFGWTAGDIEKELQKQYGYKVDKNHYQKSREVRRQQGLINLETGHWKSINQYKTLTKGQPITESQLRARKSNNLIRSSAGGKTHRKLTIQQAEEIIQLRKQGIYLKDIAKIYDLTVSSISKIARGQSYN